MSFSSLVQPHHYWMKKALLEAERAFDKNEIPVGAVIVHRERVIGRGHNMVEALNDPTAHAELIAITAACETIKNKFLAECTMYVTLEPCPMCAGALVWARLERLVFGAFDEKAGGASTLYNIPQDKRLNHQIDVISGVQADQCEALLKNFFVKKRLSAQRN